MAKRYSSFLVRWWCLPGGEQRLAIQHIQSGSQTVVASRAAAFEWMGARCCEGEGGSPDAAGRPDSAAPGVAEGQA